MKPCTQTTLREFLSSARSLAQRAINQYYTSSSGTSISAILHSAIAALSREDALDALCAEVDRLEPGVRASLLESMFACARPPVSRTDVSFLPRLDASQQLVAALAILAGGLPSRLLDALSRLELTLTLGQTDDHSMFARHALLAGAATAQDSRVARHDEPLEWLAEAAS